MAQHDPLAQASARDMLRNRIQNLAYATIERQNGLTVRLDGEGIEKLIDSLMPEPINGATSDGYHTFNELYEYRLLYNALLFNAWAQMGLYDVHKSERHGDGELCFGGGWFVVMAELPTGQISNHYPMDDWCKFQIPERGIANTWDGHSPEDVLSRMRRLFDMDVAGQ